MWGNRFRGYTFENPEAVIEELPYQTVENGSLDFGVRTGKNGQELWNKIYSVLEERLNLELTPSPRNADLVYDKDAEEIYALTPDAIDDLEDMEYTEKEFI